jgi:ATP-dependent Clp protease adapter protein ClpS
MRDRKGYFKLVELRGIPVFVHWSLPAGGVLVSLIGHVDPKQWVYYCIAYTLLVAIHELGHVLAAVVLKLKVFSVEISGVGGVCHFERPRQIRHSVLVYTAGLIAQTISFLLALAYLNVFGAPDSILGGAVIITFIFANLVLFVINLIPQRSRSGFATDGAILWRLFLHKFGEYPHPHPPLVVTPVDQAPIFPPETKLLQKPGFRPSGFVHGIELLNDCTTPMEFVISCLMTHLGLTRDEAIVKMLDIHYTGGMLIALPTEEEAHRIADAVSAEARAAGHSFVCRYAGVQQSI